MPPAVVRHRRCVHIPVLGVYRLDIRAFACRNSHFVNFIKKIRDAIDDDADYRACTCIERDGCRFFTFEIQDTVRHTQPTINSIDISTAHLLLNGPRQAGAGSGKRITGKICREIFFRKFSQHIFHQLKRALQIPRTTPIQQTVITRFRGKQLIISVLLRSGAI